MYTTLTNMALKFNVRVMLLGGTVFAVLITYALLNLTGHNSMMTSHKDCDKGVNDEDRCYLLSHNSASPNRTWIAARQRLLSSTDGASSPVTKVLMFAYMRGGSSVFGELFNLKPASSILWYEPLDAYYMAHAGYTMYSNPLSLLYREIDSKRREMRRDERLDFTDYLERLARCQVEELPVETLAHHFLYETDALRTVYRCMEGVQATNTLLKCVRNIATYCGGPDETRRQTSSVTRHGCTDLIRTLRELRPKGGENVNKENSIRTALEMIKRQEMIESSFAMSRLDPLDHNADTVLNVSENVMKTEVWNLTRFYDHHKCIADLNEMSNQCRIQAKLYCRHAKLIAIQVIRAAMSDLEALVQRVPDLHLIYYVRDPRAIAHSRAMITRMTFQPSPADTLEERFNPRQSLLAEARMLCIRMEDDLRAKRYLEKKYPGLITVVKYEDYIYDTNTTVTQMFRSINQPIPEKYPTWIKSVMKSDRETDAFDIYRTNAEETASNWKSKINYADAKKINKLCRFVLDQLGYSV